MISPRLLAAVENFAPTDYSGRAYRHIAERWNPLSGAGARRVGGRWNPAASFSTLYLAAERETAIAEFQRMAAKAGRRPEDFLPRRIYRYEIRLSALLDVRPTGAHSALGLTEKDLEGDDPSKCQAVGEAAEHLGLEGVIAPSATGAGTVLAIFFDAVRPDSAIDVVDFQTWQQAP